MFKKSPFLLGYFQNKCLSLQPKSESSAVGSALRSGRRGRAFESPLSDINGKHEAIIRYVPDGCFAFFVLVLTGHHAAGSGRAVPARRGKEKRCRLFLLRRLGKIFSSHLFPEHGLAGMAGSGPPMIFGQPNPVGEPGSHFYGCFRPFFCQTLPFGVAGC